MPDLELNGNREMLARSRIMKLWKPGDLFHNFSRYPRKYFNWGDRLPGILSNGIVPPGLDSTGKVLTDSKIPVMGEIYQSDKIAFIHQFGRGPNIYLPKRSEEITVFIDPQTPFLTEKDMGNNWQVNSPGELYVPRIIRPNEFIGLAVSENEIDKIFKEFGKNFNQLGLPLYDFSGKVFWPA